MCQKGQPPTTISSAVPAVRKTSPLIKAPRPPGLPLLLVPPCAPAAPLLDDSLFRGRNRPSQGARRAPAPRPDLPF
jgi:hypothetical protein